MPGVVDAAAVMVIVLVVAPAATEAGENEAVTPVGAPSRLRSMLPAKPPERETVAVTLPLAPCARLSEVGETLIPIAGVGVGPVVSGFVAMNRAPAAMRRMARVMRSKL